MRWVAPNRKDLQVFPHISHVKDLRGAFAKLAAYAPEDDDDDKEDEGGDGSSGTGADDDESGKDSSESKTGKDAIKDPEKKKLSDEAAKYRRELRDTKARAEAAEKRAKEFEDKDKSELELAQSGLKEMTERAEKAEAKLAEQALDLAFFRSGASALLNRPDQAAKLMDLKSLTPDEEGEYDSKEIMKTVEDWLKANPHFTASTDSGDDDDDADKPNSGRPSTERARNGKKANDQKLVDKFPALAGRL